MVNVSLSIVSLFIVALYALGIVQIPKLLISDELGPQAFPTLLAICLVGIAIMLFVDGIKSETWPESKAEFRRFMREDFRVFVPSALAVLAYFLVFEHFGYLLSTLIFLLSFILLLYRGPKWIGIVTAIGFSVISYMIFVMFFNAPLPHGILPI
jgi:putative tricarboxylic transport membrane protein